MSGSAAVDSNAYIAMRNGDIEVIAILASVTRFLPAVVYGELLFGAGASGRATENAQLVREFAATCTPIETSLGVAARYASVRLQLRGSGKPIPENDVWIAAACLEADVPLVTRDSHFTNVAGLRVITW